MSSVLYTADDQVWLCLWTLVEVEGAAFWRPYYCLSQTFFSSWGRNQASWEGKGCRATAIIVIYLAVWAENWRGACVSVGQNPFTGSLRILMAVKCACFLTCVTWHMSSIDNALKLAGCVALSEANEVIKSRETVEAMEGILVLLREYVNLKYIML